MTKEDEVALSTLKAWVERDKQMEGADRLENIEVYSRAIRALEQQSCDDCISREEVRKLICQNNDKYGYSDRFHEFVEQCLQLPSVQLQPKRGKWKRVVDKTGHWVWECDDCEWQQRFATNYCPDCGADMRGEE